MAVNAPSGTAGVEETLQKALLGHDVPLQKLLEIVVALDVQSFELVYIDE